MFVKRIFVLLVLICIVYTMLLKASYIKHLLGPTKAASINHNYPKAKVLTLSNISSVVEHDKHVYILSSIHKALFGDFGPVIGKGRNICALFAKWTIQGFEQKGLNAHVVECILAILLGWLLPEKHWLMHVKNVVLRRVGVQ